MEEIGQLLGGIAVMLVIALFVSIPLLTAIWAYGDAERRGKSGCLVSILVLFLSWPLGLILWFVFRPDYAHFERRR